MIKNYFKTAVRAFRKNTVTTCINVLGLSIGISAALIIFMLVEYDYSFDKWEPGRDKIYRIVSQGDVFNNSGAPVPLLEAVRRSTPGIQEAALVLQCSNGRTKVAVPQGNGKAPVLYKAQEQIVFADSGYFGLFPHEWMEGSASVALREPRRLVLTESRARQYFPGIPVSQVVGRTVVFCDTIITTVAGVVKDLKSNSDFDFSGVISLSTVSSGGLAASYNWDEWGSINSNTTELVKLAPGVGVAGIDKQIAAVYGLHKDDGVRKQVHRLQALSDIHTNMDFDGKVNATTVRNLIWLAVFLLLLGAINFINLSTAHAAERAKEIGIRKTLGGQRVQLILQFLTETFVLTAATAVVSVLISPLLLRAFSGFVPEGLKIDRFLIQPVVWGFLLLLVVTVSVIAGLYPALVLSGCRPVSVLKGGFIAGGTRGVWLRKVLIVLQFAVAQVFIVAVFVVDRQIHYSIEKDMGFKKDAIVNFNVPFDFEHPNGKKYVLRDEIARIPGIERVSLASQSPAFGGRMASRLTFKEKKQDLNLDVDSRWGDTSFIGVYGLSLIAGRNIGYSDTANEVLVNETLARRLGFLDPGEAVNHFVNLGSTPLPIVGVIRDFNLASLRSFINPMIYTSDLKHGFVMHVAMPREPSRWPSVIKRMEAAWKQVYPEEDFDYSFMDKKIADLYAEDQQLSTLLAWSAGIAILISCLGLLGLVIFVTNQRVKEIGVRKVLGASVWQIVGLLSVDFVRLLLVAVVIAMPVAWWQTHSWLENFAYHTELSWWIFAVSGVAMIGVAFLVMGVRAGKAAMANPVDSLRTD